MTLVAAGANPMDLKRGIDLAVVQVVADLRAHARPVAGTHEIAQIGTISANGDTLVGSKIAEAMERVGTDGVISVEQGSGLAVELKVVEGMQFDRGYLSPYFVTDEQAMTVEFDNPHILIHERSWRPCGRCCPF
jgi:chaperonin GroEL